MPPEKSKGIYIKVSPKEMQAIRERMESVGIQNMSAYMQNMQKCWRKRNLRMQNIAKRKRRCRTM